MLAYRPAPFQRSQTLLPTITFTVLNADAYDSGDVLADTGELANALAVSGGGGILQTVKLTDKDDNAAAAMTVWILKSNVSLGTKDSAPSISDTNADEIIAKIDLTSTDWTDVGGAKVAFKGNLAIPVRVSTGTSLWVALTTGGTPTQTTGGLTGIFGILAD